MNQRTRTLASRLLLASAAFVAVALLILALPGGTRQDGPVLISDAVTVEYEYAAGEATTWGMTLPRVSGDSPAVLLNVKPSGVSGLDIIGIEACDTGSAGCNIVNARGWPLTGVETLPVLDLPLRLVDSGTTSHHLLVGVRRHSDAKVGTIAAIKLVYRIDGTTFEVTEPWTLRILAPGTDVAPS